MTGRENESVAIDPAWIRGIDLQCLTEENGTDIGRSKGKSKMARLAGCDGIDCETAGIARGELEDVCVHKFRRLEHPSLRLLASILHEKYRHNTTNAQGITVKSPRGAAA